MKKNLIAIGLLLTVMHAQAENIDTAIDSGVDTTTEKKHITTYAIEVPSANNFISNKMMLAAIKSGSGSNSIDTIVNFLKSETPADIMVFGNNDAIVVATIEQAIKAMKGEPSSSSVLFNGGQKECDEINLFAKDTGIKVITTVKN